MNTYSKVEVDVETILSLFYTWRGQESSNYQITELVNIKEGENRKAKKWNCALNDPRNPEEGSWKERFSSPGVHLSSSLGHQCQPAGRTELGAQVPTWEDRSELVPAGAPKVLTFV